MIPKKDSDSSRKENVSLEQIYQCSICNHNLSSFHNLEVHTMICHEYKCPECYEQLSSKVELFHHTKSVHHEKKHCCSHCDLKFSLMYTLDNHIANEHKEKLGLNVPLTPTINDVKPLPEKSPMSRDSQAGPLIESPSIISSCSSEADLRPASSLLLFVPSCDP